MKTCCPALFCCVTVFFVTGGNAQDTIPPTLAGASSLDGQQMGICFSEEMELSGLMDAFSYEVADSAGTKTILSIAVQPGNRAVVLSLSEPVSGQFTVTVQSLSDLAGNPIPPGANVTSRVWPAAPTATDIGVPSPSGTVLACDENQLTVQAGGTLKPSNLDQFTFVHLRRTNDFDVCVRVDGVREADGEFCRRWVGNSCSAGLMVRASLEPGSAFRAVLATPTNGANRLLTLCRASTDGVAGHQELGPEIRVFPVWLRLKRSGAFVTAYSSTDGFTWTKLGSTLSLPFFPAEAYVGLATAAHAAGVAVSANYGRFDNVVLYSNVVVEIVRQPTNTTVELNNVATFSVAGSITGAPAEALQFQWQAEVSVGSGFYTNVHFANAPDYTTPFLTDADSGTRFRALVFVKGHPGIMSNPAAVTVVPDTTGPRTISATGTRRLREIVLAFNEALERTVAEDARNYSVAGLGVTSATLDATGTRVTLALDTIQSPGTTNVVESANLRDLAGNLLSPNPSTMPAPAWVMTRGFAVRELYYGIAGFFLSELRAAPAFPDFATELRYVTDLEGLDGWLTDYGTRLSGFLIPPITGSYHFWICSNDEGEFRLSTGVDPMQLALICREPEWNEWRDYLGTTRRNAAAPENRSQTLHPDGVPLVAGQPYYFEALSKEGIGTANFSVTWQLPGGPPPANGAPPIPGAYLATLADPAQATLQIRQHPTNALYSFNGSTGSGARDLLNETFTTGNGGFTAANVTGDAAGGWIYDANVGFWSADGMPDNTTNRSDKALTSLPLTVSRSGHAEISFDHRFSFESEVSFRWDGGQVRVSTNGGSFATVPNLAFSANGYNGVLDGNSGLLGQEAFIGESPGYALGQNITSRAHLGFFSSGDVIRVQFIGGWDEFLTGTKPNWVIDSLRLTEGLPGGRAATFAVLAEGALSDAPNQEIANQWQRDCGAGFADIPGATGAIYSFVPASGDASCRFRCLVTLPGLSVPSAAATLSNRLPVLSIRRQGDDVVIIWTETGHLQDAVNVTGPWENVAGVTNNAHIMAASGPRRYYRVVVP